MRIILSTLIFLSIATNIFAQTRDTSWQDLRVVETEYYSLKIPANWLEAGKVSDLVYFSFDATGIYFTDSINNAPIIAGCFVMNAHAENLEDAKIKCLKGYRDNPDRIFPKDFKEDVYDYQLSSGQKAYLISTRFFRPSKQLNQSRFDLVVYSDKAKEGFAITISVQYNDGTYSFAEKNKLKTFAEKIYSSFYLK